jgi:uncharacterized repeat protein (TIGR03847 family)
MPPKHFDFNPVDHITTGAIGPPGKRVFYLQARKDEEVVTLIIEKIQIQSLAVGVEKYLQELAEQKPELPPVDVDYTEDEMVLETPIDPAFRAGQIGLGYDEESDRIVIVAREITTDESDEDWPASGPPALRFSLSPATAWRSQTEADRSAHTAANPSSPKDTSAPNAMATNADLKHQETAIPSGDSIADLEP